jgi:WD40 repeat protein
VWDEESGELHRELHGFPGGQVAALTTFLSPDGHQPRLVAGSYGGTLRVYDPEVGSELHYLQSHADAISDLACIASSSAAPHHPRLVTAYYDGAVKVWDGETGEQLASLRGPAESSFLLVAVWKDHVTGNDRIAASEGKTTVRVWDGEALTLLHDLRCGPCQHLSAFKSAEGPARLLVGPAGDGGLQVWDPEEGRLLHDGINRGCPWFDCQLFESAQGRHLLAIVGVGSHHPRHPGDTQRPFLDVWDLGQAPAWGEHVRPAHHLG